MEVIHFIEERVHVVNLQKVAMVSPRHCLMQLIFLASGLAFIVPTWREQHYPANNILFDKKAYRFGDFTNSILGTTAKILVGKDDNYEFGDITKGVIQKAKEAVNQFSGKEDYEFGDLTRALDRKAKEKASEFTGKGDYEVGDVTKEILRRVHTNEYKVEDILFLVKILVTLGADFSPLASLLPAKLLLEMMIYSIAQEASGRILDIVTTTLDKRFKESIVGDANYKLGDLTKKTILNFVGKDERSYEFGDLTRTISKKIIDKDKVGVDEILNSEFKRELECWDDALELNSLKSQ